MQSAQSNRVNDDRIDGALGPFAGVMAYDIEVFLEGEHTGLQIDHIMRTVHDLEATRAM